MSKLVRCIAIAFALSFTAAAVHAQEKYPTKPIRLLTPFAAGGGSDILARLIGPHVYEDFGQPVIVDNRPGGGGTLGAGIAVNAAPDGYTLILVSGSYGANGALYKLPYDSVTGITPIILIGTTCLVVTMHPSVPIKTIKDLIAYAKGEPRQAQHRLGRHWRSRAPGGANFSSWKPELDFTHDSIQRHRPGHERSAHRGGRTRASAPWCRHPAREVGTAARHRRDHPQALARITGRAYHR